MTGELNLIPASSTPKKRENSTNQNPYLNPSASSGWALCEITEPTDFNNPVFLIQDNLGGFRGSGYAYALFRSPPATTNNLLYNVVKMIWENGLVKVFCELDVLATFKTLISSYSTYVLRSASESDLSIVDTLYDTKGISFLTRSYAGTDPLSSNIGSYVVQFIGKNGTQLAVMSNTQFDRLADALWTSFNSLDEVTELISGLADPMQYILDVKYFPLNVAQWFGGVLPSTYSDLTMGNFSINTGLTNKIEAYSLPVTNIRSISTISYSIPIPKHPNAYSRPYLKCDKYSQYSMVVPGGSNFSLDASRLYNYDYIRILLNTDPISGIGTFKLFLTNTPPNFRDSEFVPFGDEPLDYLMEYQCQLGIPWLLYGNERPSVADTASSVGNVAKSTVSGLASGGLIGAAVGLFGGVVSEVAGHSGDIAQFAVSPTPTVKGGLNGVRSLFQQTSITLTYMYAVDENVPENGKPLYAVRRLGTLSGYVLCKDAHIVSGYGLDIDSKINQYLTTGFFME